MLLDLLRLSRAVGEALSGKLSAKQLAYCIGADSVDSADSTDSAISVTRTPEDNYNDVFDSITRCHRNRKRNHEC